MVHIQQNKIIHTIITQNKSTQLFDVYCERERGELTLLR